MTQRPAGVNQPFCPPVMPQPRAERWPEDTLAVRLCRGRRTERHALFTSGVGWLQAAVACSGAARPLRPRVVGARAACHAVREPAHRRLRHLPRGIAPGEPAVWQTAGRTTRQSLTPGLSSGNGSRRQPSSDAQFPSPRAVSCTRRSRVTAPAAGRPERGQSPNRAQLHRPRRERCRELCRNGPRVDEVLDWVLDSAGQMSSRSGSAPLRTTSSSGLS